jgi:hypothetical protein
MDKKLEVHTLAFSSVEQMKMVDFLETSINGAFAEQSTANTTFTGISSYGWLSNDWSYNALGTLASTQLNIKGCRSS